MRSWWEVERETGQRPARRRANLLPPFEGGRMRYKLRPRFDALCYLQVDQTLTAVCQPPPVLPAYELSDGSQHSATDAYGPDTAQIWISCALCWCCPMTGTPTDKNAAYRRAGRRHRPWALASPPPPSGASPQGSRRLGGAGHSRPVGKPRFRPPPLSGGWREWLNQRFLAREPADGRGVSACFCEKCTFAGPETARFRAFRARRRVAPPAKPQVADSAPPGRAPMKVHFAKNCADTPGPPGQAGPCGAPDS